MANNFNSNNFYFDKSVYLKDKNNRTNRGNINLSDENLESIDPNEYKLQFYDRFDTYKGLFNTQQLADSINFEKFEEHCFFDSAVSKTEYAFNTIYDKFPIDGTKKEFDDFFQNIDGFVKHIYNKFDKNIGYLKFQDSYISVKNQSGYVFSLSRNENITNKITSSVLSPNNSNFSFDFRCYISDSSVPNQVIYQYLDNTSNKFNGFSLFIKDFFTANNKKYANIIFLLTAEGLVRNYSCCKFYVPVEEWHHIVISVDKIENSRKKTNVILNEKIVYFENISDIKTFTTAENQKNYIYQNFDSDVPVNISKDFDFLIGKSLYAHVGPAIYFSLSGSRNNFKGYLDEFRYFHTSLDVNYAIKYKDKNIYSIDTLKLYFRFNEPSGSHINNSLVFDHSGNSLHSWINLNSSVLAGKTQQQIRDIISSYRLKSIGNSPLKFEETDLNPVLLPTFQKHIDLNDQYIEEAKKYDLYNPNLVFNLIPKHYLFLGSEQDKNSETYRNQAAVSYYDANSANNFPGQQKKEAAQTFINLLTIWSRFFDQIKLYLQVLPEIINLDYADIASSSSVNFFIPLMAKIQGFDFKEILNSPTNKILDGYILGADGEDKSQYTLRYIQNEIWKRILINSNDMLSSKGTVHAVRSVFNSVGMPPDEYYRFREYGTRQDVFVDESNTNAFKNIQVLNFKNIIPEDPDIFSEIVDIPGFQYHQYKINSNCLFLSHPYFDFYEENIKNLSLEFLLKYDLSVSKDPNVMIESILKFEEIDPAGSFPVQMEIIFIKKSLDSTTGDLYFFIKDYLGQKVLSPDVFSSYPSIKNIELMDGMQWHFSIQLLKEENINKVKLNVNRAGSVNQYQKQYTLTLDVPKKHDLIYFNSINRPSKIMFGSRSAIAVNSKRKSTAFFFDESKSIAENEYISHFSKYIIDAEDLFKKYINFNGNISFLKMWKKNSEFSEKEIIDHAQNPFSISCDEFLFSKKQNKKINDFLILDVSCQQDYNESIDYQYSFISDLNLKFSTTKLIDYSQTFDITDSFDSYKTFISYDFIKKSNDTFDILQSISNKGIYIKKFDSRFDEINITNKVNIAGYTDIDMAEKEKKEIAPVHSLNNYINKTKSDIRFSIEMSNVKHLNEDISLLFSGLSYITNSISNLSNLNESFYPDLEKLQISYFKRLTSERPNITPLYEIYQIFDNILTELLRQFVPSRVKFYNNIYTIESHSLERHKFYYKQYESQSPIIGNIEILSPFNSKRNLNYLNKQGRILREYD